jgi:hypothetical protein
MWRSVRMVAVAAIVIAFILAANNSSLRADTLIPDSGTITVGGVTPGEEVSVTVTPSYSTPIFPPIPTALRLFATGLGAMGLFGWRRKRKAVAIAAA